jgi:hypothetical protein
MLPAHLPALRALALSVDSTADLEVLCLFLTPNVKDLRISLLRQGVALDALVQNVQDSPLDLVRLELQFMFFQPSDDQIKCFSHLLCLSPNLLRLLSQTKIFARVIPKIAPLRKLEELVLGGLSSADPSNDLAILPPNLFPSLTIVEIRGMTFFNRVIPSVGRKLRKIEMTDEARSRDNSLDIRLFF